MDRVDPSAVLREAMRLAGEGRYAEALDRHQWYHAHALEHDPAHVGVRLSFALSAWARLGENYPPAQAALIQVRDAAVATLRAGGWAEAPFAEAAACNRYLRDEAATGALFLELRAAAPAVAVQAYRHAEDGLVALGEHRVCGEYVTDPEARLRFLRGVCGLAVAGGRLSPERAAALGPAERERWEQAARMVEELAGRAFAERAGELAEILDRAGRGVEAARVRALTDAWWPPNPNAHRTAAAVSD